VCDFEGFFHGHEARIFHSFAAAAAFCAFFLLAVFYRVNTRFICALLSVFDSFLSAFACRCCTCCASTEHIFGCQLLFRAARGTAVLARPLPLFLLLSLPSLLV